MASGMDINGLGRDFEDSLRKLTPESSILLDVSQELMRRYGCRENVLVSLFRSLERVWHTVRVSLGICGGSPAYSLHRSPPSLGLHWSLGGAVRGTQAPLIPVIVARALLCMFMAAA